MIIPENSGDTFHNNVSHNVQSNGYSIYNRYYGNDKALENEIENLKQIIACKDEIIAEKDKQISLLNRLLEK